MVKGPSLSKLDKREASKLIVFINGRIFVGCQCCSTLEAGRLSRVKADNRRVLW